MKVILAIFAVVIISACTKAPSESFKVTQPVTMNEHVITKEIATSMIESYSLAEELDKPVFWDVTGNIVMNNFSKDIVWVRIYPAHILEWAKEHYGEHTDLKSATTLIVVGLNKNKEPIAYESKFQMN